MTKATLDKEVHAMSQRTIGAAIAGAREHLREHPDEARYPRNRQR
jgi:hypothetical protein